jgi:hypothetical protein
MQQTSKRAALPQHAPAMPRRKGPEKRKISSYLPGELHEAMLDFSDASGIPVTRILEDAIRGYLKRQYWPEGEK